MKLGTWMLIGILLMFICVISGCSNEEYYMCNSCNGTSPIINVSDYSCTSRNVGEFGYNYSSNLMYYCNGSAWALT